MWIYVYVGGSCYKGGEVGIIILITVLAIIILVLISGYIENSYCHVWVSADPINDSTYQRHTTGFCKINAYPSIPGALILALI